MGRAITHTYGQPIGVLKFFDFKAKSELIPESMASADADGKKIVKAGTPFPSNDADCTGYVLQDMDVTNGGVIGAVIYEGAIDNAKLTKNGITVNSNAKAATPRVTFFD